MNLYNAFLNYAVSCDVVSEECKHIFYLDRKYVKSEKEKEPVEEVVEEVDDFNLELYTNIRKHICEVLGRDLDRCSHENYLEIAILCCYRNFNIEALLESKDVELFESLYLFEYVVRNAFDSGVLFSTIKSNNAVNYSKASDFSDNRNACALLLKELAEGKRISITNNKILLSGFLRNFKQNFSSKYFYQAKNRVESVDFRKELCELIKSSRYKELASFIDSYFPILNIDINKHYVEYVRAIKYASLEYLLPDKTFEVISKKFKVFDYEQLYNLVSLFKSKEDFALFVSTICQGVMEVDIDNIYALLERNNTSELHQAYSDDRKIEGIVPNMIEIFCKTMGLTTYGKLCAYVSAAGFESLKQDYLDIMKDEGGKTEDLLSICYLCNEFDWIELAQNSSK